MLLAFALSHPNDFLMCQIVIQGQPYTGVLERRKKNLLLFFYSSSHSNYRECQVESDILQNRACAAIYILQHYFSLLVFNIILQTLFGQKSW